ncbi:unnamed protein product [Closterium sp. Naga37s-1]|nr:unnamed protein product [Closterium sp. Naga37s-1]
MIPSGAAVCTAYGASATSLLRRPFVPHPVPGGSHAASAASAASAAAAAASTASTASVASTAFMANAPQAKALGPKGQWILKLVAKLRPTKCNGKVVGDKGASGKIVIAAVKYSASSYTTTTKFLLQNLKGGDKPVYGYVRKCTETPADSRPMADLAFVNITSAAGGQRGRYSWKFESETLQNTELDARLAVYLAVSSSFAVIGRAGNERALYGQVFSFQRT